MAEFDVDLFVIGAGPAGLGAAAEMVKVYDGSIKLGRSELGGALFTVQIPTPVRTTSLLSPARPTLH